MKKILLSLNKSVLLLFFGLCICNTFIAQNTVGTIFYDPATQDGYTLFTTHKKTFLINNCGQVVNEWTSEYTPGNAVYLLEDGDLLRAGNTQSADFQFGGNGGVIERYSWDGNLEWQYFYDNEEHRQHHDIYPMKNGNVLILASTLVTQAEAIAAGRDPDKLSEGKLYNERVIEVQPIGTDGGSIIWEWNFIDHVIQDFDASKNNFGVVGANPQRLDINYTQTEFGGVRWLHINSMQYNAQLDQIVLSSRHLNEFYIIDHSTTTAEAASTSGGIYGKGGDFLYRWGNPQAYRQGTSADQQLGGQHYPHFIESGLRDAGKIILFNNFYNDSPNFSAVFILDLPQVSPGVYTYVPGTAYGPTSPSYIYEDGIDLYSPVVSSAQIMPNGNILICEGSNGEIREIDQSNNIVWQYTLPLSNTNGNVASQGDDPASFNNLTFRAIKYAPDFPGFDGKDLTPSDPIEMNPNISSCLTLSDSDLVENVFRLYPNPTNGILNINTLLSIDKVLLHDMKGKNYKLDLRNNKIDISQLSTGMYFLKIISGNKTYVKKIIRN